MSKTRNDFETRLLGDSPHTSTLTILNLMIIERLKREQEGQNLPNLPVTITAQSVDHFQAIGGSSFYLGATVSDPISYKLLLEDRLSAANGSLTHYIIHNYFSRDRVGRGSEGRVESLAETNNDANYFMISQP